MWVKCFWKKQCLPGSKLSLGVSWGCCSQWSVVCLTSCSGGGGTHLDVPVWSLKWSPLEAPCKENPIDDPPPLLSCSCMPLTWDCPDKTFLSSTDLEGAPGTVDLGLAPVCSHPFAQLELVPFTPMNPAKTKVEYSNTNWSL